MDHEKAAREFEEIGAVTGGKRLAVNWTPWMGDWFVSHSPRNNNGNAEGQWFQWAHLAAKILRHPMTKEVAPELYRPDLPNRYLYDEADKTMGDATIARLIEEQREDARKAVVCNTQVLGRAPVETIPGE